MYIDIPTRHQQEKRRRAIQAKKKPDVATLEMKLTDNFKRPGTAQGGPRSLADLKLGMNSITRTGIQQNTSCLFNRELAVPPSSSIQPKSTPAALPQCTSHPGHKKPLTDQNNPYEKVETPLTNLSPYLKQTRGISDEEEQKILELIRVFKKRAQSWDDIQQERFRRFLELQQPDFRSKLLECMKEHIQEVNLLDSFFIRYALSHLSQQKRTQTEHSLRTKTQQARKKTQGKQQAGLIKRYPNITVEKLEETKERDGRNREGFEMEKEGKETHENEIEHMAKEDHVEVKKQKKEVKIVSRPQSAKK